MELYSFLNSFINSLFEICSQVTKANGGNGKKGLALTVNVLESSKTSSHKQPLTHHRSKTVCLSLPVILLDSSGYLFETSFSL